MSTVAMYDGKEKVGKGRKALTLTTREWNIAPPRPIFCSYGYCRPHLQQLLLLEADHSTAANASSLTSRATSPHAEEGEP